jgi:multimeric flavodoxin WrbA
MNTGIISASNVFASGENSISIKAGEMLKQKLQDKNSDANVSIIDLRQYSLTPCRMCEKCGRTQKCVNDPDFNKLWDQMKYLDEYVIICPHYAPIPSKLIIMLEKIEEMSYVGYCSGRDEKFPLEGKRVFIIAHGGMTRKYETLYSQNILQPLTNVFKTLGMNVMNEKGFKPICFGVKGFEKSESKITYDILHNFEEIGATIDDLMELYNEA